MSRQISRDPNSGEVSDLIYDACHEYWFLGSTVSHGQLKGWKDNQVLPVTCSSLCSLVDSATIMDLRLLLVWLLASRVTAYTILTNETLKRLPLPGGDFDIKSGTLLSPILRPRVPGSVGSTYVRNHFVDFFKTALPKWEITHQNSTSKTPATGDKELPFINVIMARDPPWTKPGEVSRLTLVAHYDSKLTPEGFIGATDSAAPCAMLMHAAKSIDSALTKKWDAMQKEGLGEGGYLGFEDHQGVQIIFLDGEEAFVTWTDDDSLYGAKSLAAEWESTVHPATSTFHNPLSSISLFVLLDLLGAKSPNVPSYFKTTHWAYQNMAATEQRMRALSMFKSSPNHPTQKRTPVKDKKGKVKKSVTKRREPEFLVDAKKTTDQWMGGFIEDDHVPFMVRGVEVLHIIPNPFPTVWHHIDDDGEHLDIDTVIDWAMLMTAFAAEWLDLEGHFDEPNKMPTKQSRSEL